jgi:hypothetical protein
MSHNYSRHVLVGVEQSIQSLLNYMLRLYSTVIRKRIKKVSQTVTISPIVRCKRNLRTGIESGRSLIKQ